MNDIWVELYAKEYRRLSGLTLGKARTRARDLFELLQGEDPEWGEDRLDRLRDPVGAARHRWQWRIDHGLVPGATGKMVSVPRTPKEES